MLCGSMSLNLFAFWPVGLDRCFSWREIGSWEAVERERVSAEAKQTCHVAMYGWQPTFEIYFPLTIYLICHYSLIIPLPIQYVFFW